MKRLVARVLTSLIQFAPALLFVVFVIVLGVVQPKFHDPQNLLDILEQSVPVAIVGIGMTFVLLTSGIDLAVGATMYMGIVVAGHFLSGFPVPVLFLSTIVAGIVIGLLHGCIINVFDVAPFIVTLATMFVLRGIGKRITETKSIIASDAITQLERATVLGIPFAIQVLLFAGLAAWLLLRHTGLGRQIYAVGENREAAMKAGIDVRTTTLIVYAICGMCAGVGGFVAFTQQGAAQNTFGVGVEFSAIAASVLGGTSLFGGRGNAWGAIFGAVLVSTINAWLSFANADPYIYPLVTATLIFLITAFDTFRTRLLQNQTRRKIRVDYSQGGKT
jgi:ribose transport system permease protein